MDLPTLQIVVALAAAFLSGGLTTVLMISLLVSALREHRS
jgi:hypothetical protein